MAASYIYIIFNIIGLLKKEVIKLNNRDHYLILIERVACYKWRQ